MAKQNIYDYPVFFEGYKTIRDKEVNANTGLKFPPYYLYCQTWLEKGF